MIFDWHVGDFAVDRDRGVVHPGIETTELDERGVSYPPDLTFYSHVGFNVDRVTARRFELFGQCSQCGFGTRNQHESRAALRRHASSYQSDTTGGASYDDHLIFQFFQFHKNTL